MKKEVRSQESGARKRNDIDQLFPVCQGVWKRGFAVLLASVFWLLTPAFGQTPATTTVQDTVYRSDGSTASGTVVIRWPAFVTGDGRAVFGGTKTVKLTDGALAVALAPNDGGSPSGTSYDVRYFQSGGVYFEETWVVPTSSPLSSPAAPSVMTVGTPGSTTYYYWVTALNTNGETLLSPSGLLTTSNGTLDTNNYNHVSWSAVSGATGYRVYRTTNANAPTGSGNYLVGETAGLSLDDQSNSLSPATVPGLNTTDPRTLSDVRVTAAPSPSVTLAPSQVQGNAIVSNPSATQTITAPSGNGIPLQIKGRSNNSSNAFEVYDNQSTPILQSWFDQNGAFQTAQAPTFSSVLSGSLLFGGTGGLLSQDNSNLYWDNTDQRLFAGPRSGMLANWSQFYIDSSKNAFAAQNVADVPYTYALSAVSDDDSTDSLSAFVANSNSTHTSGTRNYQNAALAFAATHGAGTTNNLLGTESIAANNGGGTVTTAIGGQFSADLYSTGNVGTGVGVDIVNRDSGAGSFTNLYGIRIADQTAGTNNWAIKTGLGKVQIGDTLYAKALNEVRFADQFSGADAGEKIAAAIAALPASGGTVDARGLVGAQSITSDMFSGVTKPVVLLLGASTYTVTAQQTIQTSNQWIIGLGPQVTFLQCDIDGDCIRVQNSPFQPLQMGGGLVGFRMDGCALPAFNNCGSRPNSHGIHIGDVIGFVIRDVYVRDFQGANNIGLWADNVTNHTERLWVENVWLFQSTENLTFTVNGGTGSFAYNSFLGLRINVKENQIAVRSEDNASIEGSQFFATINDDSADNSATMLSIAETSLWQNNTYHIQADSTQASTFLDVAPGAAFKGFGIVQPAASQMNSIAGTFQIELQFGNVELAGGLTVQGRSSNNVVRTPGTRRWIYSVADGASSALDVLGDEYTVTGTASALAAGSPVINPPFVRYTSAAGSNNDAGIHGQPNWSAAKAPMLETSTRLVSQTEIRWWAGFTSAPDVATMTASDDPAGDYAAFLYCNDTGSGCAADYTNYHCVTKDGTTQNNVDSGVPVDGTVHKFLIEFASTGSVNFKIDGTAVCSSPVTANVPRTNQSMRIVNGVQTMSTGTRSNDVAFAYAESD